MEAYSAVAQDDEDRVQLKGLCDRLVYINNNLRVYDITFERSWFSGSLGIEFRSQTNRDAVVKDTSKATSLLEKMARKQPAAKELEVGDVLIGLNQKPLEGDFMEKMTQVKEMRKNFTLTFAKLDMPEEPLDYKSDEEMTEVCLANPICKPPLLGWLRARPAKKLLSAAELVLAH